MKHQNLKAKWSSELQSLECQLELLREAHRIGGQKNQKIGSAIEIMHRDWLTKSYCLQELIDQTTTETPHEQT